MPALALVNVIITNVQKIDSIGIADSFIIHVKPLITPRYLLFISPITPVLKMLLLRYASICFNLMLKSAGDKGIAVEQSFIQETYHDTAGRLPPAKYLVFFAKAGLLQACIANLLQMVRK